MSADDHRFSREALAGYPDAILGHRLLLVGAGAVGDAIARQLAMWGFGQCTVIDPDSYELSNATRVLDFPHAAVRAGRRVGKADHVAACWRARLEAAGLAGQIDSWTGWAQEAPARLFREAALVISAVDHPRARLDVALLARRYGRPLVTGGFDAMSCQVSVDFYPGEPSAACYACSLAEVPGYAASSASCTAAGLRAQEARTVPATATLAAAAASLVVQRVVDGLAFGMPAVATTTHVALRARPGATGRVAEVSRAPSCPHHEPRPATRLVVEGDRLGDFLASLAKAAPDASLRLPCWLPVFVVADDAASLIRVAAPPWRCPALFHVADHAAAPADAASLVLDELDLELAKRLALTALPASWFGLGPGACVESVSPEGDLTGWEIASPSTMVAIPSTS